MEEANQISSKMEKVFLFGSHLGIYGAFLFRLEHDSQLSVVSACVKKNAVVSVFYHLYMFDNRVPCVYVSAPDYAFSMWSFHSLFPTRRLTLRQCMLSLYAYNA